MNQIQQNKDHERLLACALALQHSTIAVLAWQLGLTVPNDRRLNKGWLGTLLEKILGVTAPHRSGPDFHLLAVELKTIPISRSGVPLESTFVCTLNLHGQQALQPWENCVVHEKLQRLLWIPILGDRNEAWGQRTIGRAQLWQPNAMQTKLLKQDWQELSSKVMMGQLDQISARLGEVMQIRPKGADSKALTQGYDEEGNRIATLPRGIYLRPKFTQEILIATDIA